MTTIAEQQVPQPLVAPPGLKGLVVADTSVGAVRGADGVYHYREHNAADLARTHTIEEVWHLLWKGHLPDPAEAEAFRSSVADARKIPTEVLALVDALADRVEAPHHLLLAALPLVRPEAQPTLDLTDGARRADALACVAATPVVLSRLLRPGARLPEPTGSHAGDWLALTTGVDSARVPANDPVDGPVAAVDDRAHRALERYLIATIDHGFNASTFATRVVTSTGADVVSALAAGVGALAGPLHGGAPARALAMIDEIGAADRAGEWVEERMARGDKIMGFGHAVYRAGDPRSALMRETAEWWSDPLVARAVDIEAAVLEAFARLKPDAVIVTNVEYYAGVVLHLAGLPPEAFTPSFTVSRLIGWGAHLLEQAADNKILRPSARYVGPLPAGMDGLGASA